jgi:ribose 5-phosphate isomerase B
LAIIFGGSGQGEAMMANRIKNVRATTYYSQNKEILKLSKEHNNANILSIGARFFEEKEQKKELFDDIIF